MEEASFCDNTKSAYSSTSDIRIRHMEEELTFSGFPNALSVLFIWTPHVCLCLCMFPSWKTEADLKPNYLLATSLLSFWGSTFNWPGW